MVYFDGEFETESEHILFGVPLMRRHRFRFREVPKLRPSDCERTANVRPPHNSRLHMTTTFVFFALQLTTFYYQIYAFARLEPERSRLWFLIKCSLALFLIEMLRLLVNIYLTVQIVMCYAFS